MKNLNLFKSKTGMKSHGFNQFFAYLFIMGFCLIFLTGCPPFYWVEAKPDPNHKFKTTKELEAYINEKIPETKFTLKEDCLYTTKGGGMMIYLTADDLPGKTVKALQFYTKSYYNFDGDDTPSKEWLRNDEFELEEEINSARFIDMDPFYRNPYKDFFFTDYYFIKYQDEINLYFESFFEPCTKELVRNKDYVLFAENEFSYTSITPQTKEDLLSLRWRIYLFVNQKLTQEKEREVKAFCYDLINRENWPDNTFTCFYSTKYNVQDIKLNQLTNGTFEEDEDLIKISCRF